MLLSKWLRLLLGVLTLCLQPRTLCMLARHRIPSLPDPATAQAHHTCQSAHVNLMQIEWSSPLLLTTPWTGSAEERLPHPLRPSMSTALPSRPTLASASPCTAMISAFTRSTSLASTPFRCSRGLYSGRSSSGTCANRHSQCAKLPVLAVTMRQHRGQLGCYHFA